MATKGFLGIDAGTQGLSVIFTDESLNVIAMGEGGYEMVSGLDEGCYEQHPDHWIAALKTAMENLRSALPAEHKKINVQSIGISGQMHGEVLADDQGKCLGPARLWCDARNDDTQQELTESLGVKMPKRITAARWLWTVRNQSEKAKQARHMTTPAGWIAFQLTGEWSLGIGDAAGMFPIDQKTLDYDQRCLSLFEQTVSGAGVTPLSELLPSVRRAGEFAGALTSEGAALLALTDGIPVAPAEGDQPAALAGSLIGNAGMVSVSFGTSVCANSVGDRPFEGVSSAVDHFCAPDGKPINMVWLRNGTTYMNSIVEMFGEVMGDDRAAGFAAVMPKLLEADVDCGGLLALPFMDDEPGLNVGRGGTAMIVGLNPDNAKPGNVAKATLLATMFNLKLGSEVLDRQGFPRTELVLSGGLAKTPELGQLLADVFGTRVSLLESAEEGTAWGAALMAKFRFQVAAGVKQTWAEFLSGLNSGQQRQFEPHQEASEKYQVMFERYKKLMSVQSQLQDAVDV